MITLTMKDEKRLEVIQRVFRGELTVVEAALVLGVSERQCYRVKARVSKDGVKGVIHANRGRLCKHKIKEKTVKRIVGLARISHQRIKIALAAFKHSHEKCFIPELLRAVFTSLASVWMILPNRGYVSVCTGLRRYHTARFRQASAQKNTS